MAEEHGTQQEANALDENLYMPLNASNLTAIIMKGSPNSSERDAGFCSGSSEGGDDYILDHVRLEASNPTSPTDSTQDSVDVVSLVVRNKRKSSEPAKIVDDAAAVFAQQQINTTKSSTAVNSNGAVSRGSIAHMGPLKKRIRYTSSADSAVALTPPAISSPPLAAMTDVPTEAPSPPSPSPSPLPASPKKVVRNMTPPQSPSPSPTPTETTVPEIKAATVEENIERHADIAKAGADDAHATQQPQLWNPYHYMPNPAHVFVRHPGVTTLHRTPIDTDDVSGDIVEQKEPLNLVVRKLNAINSSVESDTPMTTTAGSQNHQSHSQVMSSSYDEREARSPQLRPQSPASIADTADRRPRCVSVSTEASMQADDTIGDDGGAVTSDAHLMPPTGATQSSSRSSSSSSSARHSHGNGTNSGSSRPQQRNYKNMTRERRIEANARERTRVHTISAAYETLRHAVPSYSNAQKLSKLSVLRIACTYILALSRMAGHDYSHDLSAPSVSDCLESLTATIQAEGKIQKKKKDGD